MSYLEDLKRRRLSLIEELSMCRKKSDITHDLKSDRKSLSYNKQHLDSNKSNLSHLEMIARKSRTSRNNSYQADKIKDEIDKYEKSVTGHFVSINQYRSELENVERLEKLIKEIEQSIADEEKKISLSVQQEHDNRKDLLKQRHQQLTDLLDRMETKRQASGVNALQIERERTRRMEIDHQIQGLINENDEQDRAELDSLLNELRDLAVGGLPNG